MEPLESLKEEIKALEKTPNEDFELFLGELLKKAEADAKKSARRMLFLLILFSIGLLAIGFAAGRFIHF
jgi:hypothetical protein